MGVKCTYSPLPSKLLKMNSMGYSILLDKECMHTFKNEKRSGYKTPQFIHGILRRVYVTMTTAFP